MPDATPALSSRGLDPAARDAVAAATARTVAQGWARRIWDRDAALWSADPAVQQAIGQRLGWLDLPTDFQERVPELIGLAAGLRAEGCRRALVCGMGGSSLAPWVIARVWPADPEGIAVAVLDSTDPQAVEADAAETGLPDASCDLVVRAEDDERRVAQEDEPAPRPQHPCGLGDRSTRVGQVHQGEAAQRGMGRRVLQRQPRHVGLNGELAGRYMPRHRERQVEPDEACAGRRPAQCG